ncbi:MAG: transcription regulator LuxR family protein [uncultured bacterium]|nr:MAG: transcription regulator LuxR family protein [uncultured bacterium]
MKSMHCAHCYENIINQLPGFIVCMDLTGNYIYVNQAFSSLLGFKNKEDVTGLAFKNAPCKVSEYADVHEKQNQEVVKSNAVIKLLDIHPYANNEIVTILTSKAPFKDVAGHFNVIAHGTVVSRSMLLKISTAIAQSDKRFRKNKNPDQRSYKIVEPIDCQKLSAREIECMFYLIRGKTMTQIATILRLSKRTVEYYLQNIKNKWSCHTKSDLIEKAIETGWIDFIPKNIFNYEDMHVSALLEK